jgi:hypothetical protein
MMKKSNKQPSRPAAKSAKPAAKAMAAKPVPSLVDMKNLVGQMKGMLTSMSKERLELQKMIERGRELLDRIEPPSNQHVLDAIKAVAGDALAPEDDMHSDYPKGAQSEHPNEHGDPVVSGTANDESEF